MNNFSQGRQTAGRPVFAAQGLAATAFALVASTAFGQTAPAEPAVDAAAEAPANAVEAADARALELKTVTVIGTREDAEALPGSHQTISAETLSKAHVMTTTEALRKTSGVNVRDEEGLGLRPNIGIRGLNPTRSTKVLLLEDGIPLAYAPYGDNASYYHPPVDRFDRIEVLKGAAMNSYGPQTVGGVINYLTPTPPEDFEGFVRGTVGDRDYFNGHAALGARGLRFDALLKSGDGARDNIHSDLQDYNLKGVFELSENHTLIGRVNQYIEDSQLTYSGLTDAEYASFGARYNPFENDTFDGERQGLSMTHDWRIGERANLTTNLYYASFARDWWRQASTTTDSQCNGTTYDVNGQTLNFQDARLAGFAVDPDDCNSVQGRLRDYATYGVEPRLRLRHGLFGLNNELTLGARAHFESQERRQINGTSPSARSGTLVEHNERLADAYSGFVQNRFGFGAFELTPGLRVESIHYERTNELTGANGDEEVTEVIHSLGASYKLSSRLTLFAGVHEGFSPPRTEDLIGNDGISTDVKPEQSTNWELGLRSRPVDGLNIEATVFRNDFEREIAVGSIAGGSTPLAEGETLHQGLELTLRADFSTIFEATLAEAPVHPWLQLAYTGLPDAHSESAFLRVDNGQPVTGSAAGKRLPYAPENLLTTTLGFDLPAGFDVQVEAVYIDEQFADFANTRDPNGSGQVGLIDALTLWNAALNWAIPGTQLTVFAAAKNLTDENYIADRTRGIQTGAPSLLQAGAEWRF